MPARRIRARRAASPDAKADLLGMSPRPLRERRRAARIFLVPICFIHRHRPAAAAGGATSALSQAAADRYLHRWTRRHAEIDGEHGPE